MRGSADLFSTSPGLSAGSNAFGSEFSAVNCSSPRAATFPEPSGITSFEGWISDPTRSRRAFQSTSSKVLRAKPQDVSLTPVAAADSSGHGIAHGSLADSQAAATRSQLSPSPTANTSHPPSSPSAGTFRLRVPSGFICPLTGRILRDPVIPVPVLLPLPQLLPHAGPLKAAAPSPLRATAVVATVQPPAQQMKVVAQHESPAATALAPEALAVRYRLPQGTSGWYERAAILSWLAAQSSGAHILLQPQLQLVANVSLRVAIQEWLQQHSLDYAAADQLLLLLQLEREQQRGQEREGEGEQEDTAAQCGTHSGKGRGLFPDGEAGPVSGIGPGIALGAVQIPVHPAAIATAPAPVRVPVLAGERIRHTACGFGVATNAVATGAAAAPSDAAAAATSVVQQVQVPVLATHVRGAPASAVAPLTAAVSAAAPSIAPVGVGVGVGAAWTWSSSRGYECLRSSVSSSWGSGALGSGGGGSWPWRTEVRPPPAPTATAPGPSPALAGIGHGLESWGGSRIAGATTESSTPAPLASGIASPAAAGWTLVMGEGRRGSPEGASITARLPQPPLRYPGLMLHRTYSAVTTMAEISAFGGTGRAAAVISCTATAGPKQTSTSFANAVEAVTAAAAGFTPTPGDQALSYTGFEAAAATAGPRPAQPTSRVSERSGDGIGGVGCRSWPWQGVSLYQQHALPRQHSGHTAAAATAALPAAVNGGGGSSSLCVERLLTGPPVTEEAAGRLYHRSLSAPASSPPLPAPRQGLPLSSTDTQQLLRPLQQQEQQLRHPSQQPFHHRRQQPQVPQPLHRLSREWSAGSGSSVAVTTRDRQRGGAIRIAPDWPAADVDQLMSAGQGAVDRRRAPEPRCAQPPPSLPQPQQQQQYAKQQHLTQPGLMGRGYAEPLPLLLPQQHELCPAMGLQALPGQAAKHPSDPQYFADSRGGCISVLGDLSSPSVMNAAQWDVGGDKGPIWRRLWSGGSGAMRTLLNRLQGQMAGLWSRGKDGFLTGWGTDPWGGDETNDYCGADTAAAAAAVPVQSASDSEAMVSARGGCSDSESGGIYDSCLSGKGSKDGDSIACGGDGAGGRGWMGSKWEVGRRAESLSPATRQEASSAILSQANVDTRPRAAGALSGCREASGGVDETTTGGAHEASIGGRWWRRMAAYRSHPSFLRAEDVGTAPARNLDLDLQNPVRGKDRGVGWQKPGYRRADDGGSGDDDASRQRPPPGPLELPLELPLPLQWLTADQLADCGLSARDEAQAAERQRQRVWRWLRGVPPPACRDLLTLLRCTTLAPETRPMATAAPLTSLSMATRRGRGLAAAPLRCISVGSHLPHRITALAVLPPPPGPPALAYSLSQFPADTPSSGDGAPISAPTGDGGAAVAGGIPPAPSPPTRGSFAILVTRDHPGHVLVEELPSAAAAAAVQSPSVVSEPDQSQPTDAGTGRGGRCWMVPAVRGRVTVVAACPRGGSLAIGTSAGLVFVWRCFPGETLRALQDLREMEAREQPSAAAGGPAAAAGMGPAVDGWPRRPGSGYGYSQRRGSSEAAAPMLEWQLCGRLGWSVEAEIGGGSGNDADCGVTAVAYDGTGATLFAACRGVVAGWKLRHFEQPEHVPSVVTAAFLLLTPDDYGVMANHCNTRSDGAASSSSWFGRRGSGGGRRSADDTLGSTHSAMPFTTNHDHTPEVILWNGSGARFSSGGGGSGDLPSALHLGPSPWSPHALEEGEEEEEEAAVSVAASAPLCDVAVTASLPITSSASLSLPLPSSAATASAAVFTAAAPAMASYGPPSNLTSGPLRNTASALSFRFSSAPSDLPSLPSSAPLPCWAGKHPLLNTASARNHPTVCCLVASPSGAHLALALSDGAVHLALHADSPCRTVCVRLLPPSPQSMLAGVGQPFPGWATQMAFSGDERRLLVLALGFGPTRSRRGGSGAAAAPSREHLQQRRAGSSDKDFSSWGTGGVLYNGGGVGRISSAKTSVGGKEEEGEEGAMGAAEARYSLHCFPLTQEASEVEEEEEEEEEEEAAEEGVAGEKGEFSDSTGRSDAGMVTAAGLPHRRGDSRAIGNRTAVHGTCVYAALDSDDDDDDDDDDDHPWVRDVCVLGKDGDGDDDNLVELFSDDDNAHVEGKDDDIYDDDDEGYGLGSEGVHEEQKKGKVWKLQATLLHEDAGGAPSGKAGVPGACAGAAKDAVADLEQQHPLVLPVGARDQGLAASRDIAGGIYNRHPRQLSCSEAPSDVAASRVFARGNGCPRSRLQLQRRCRHGHCGISRTAGLGGGEGADDGGNGGRGGGGGGGCYSEVVLCGLRVPTQSALWRPRLANLVVATDGTSALLLDRCPTDMHPWEPGSYCNQNCQQSKQSPQQILLQLQEGQQDHQQFPARKHQPRKQRQQLVFVDMATGRARRLPLELHPCDKNYYCPYHRQDHHRHQYQQHQHQQPTPANTVSRCGSGGGAASNLNAVVDSSSAASTTATSTVPTTVLQQKKQRLCYGCCSCSCMALLPGGRELLVGGDCGLLRWTFGADGGDVSREHLWDMGL